MTGVVGLGPHVTGKKAVQDVEVGLTPSVWQNEDGFCWRLGLCRKLSISISHNIPVEGWYPRWLSSMMWGRSFDLVPPYPVFLGTLAPAMQRWPAPGLRLLLFPIWLLIRGGQERWFIWGGSRGLLHSTELAGTGLLCMCRHLGGSIGC